VNLVDAIGSAPARQPNETGHSAQVVHNRRGAREASELSDWSSQVERKQGEVGDCFEGAGCRSAWLLSQLVAALTRI